jgi:hypothetical protein
MLSPTAVAVNVASFICDDTGELIAVDALAIRAEIMKTSTSASFEIMTPDYEHKGDSFAI